MPNEIITRVRGVLGGDIPETHIKRLIRNVFMSDPEKETSSHEFAKRLLAMQDAPIVVRIGEGEFVAADFFTARDGSSEDGEIIGIFVAPVEVER